MQLCLSAVNRKIVDIDLGELAHYRHHECEDANKCLIGAGLRDRTDVAAAEFCEGLAPSSPFGERPRLLSDGVVERSSLHAAGDDFDG